VNQLNVTLGWSPFGLPVRLIHTFWGPALSIHTDMSNAVVRLARLQTLKKTITTAIGNCFGAGMALSEIQKSKLYEEENFETFEEFIQETWGISRSYAYRLIEAGDVKNNVSMSPVGDTLTTESQARELSALPKEKQVEVLEHVAKNGPVTAKALHRQVEKVAHAEPPSKDMEPSVPVDEMGFPLPEVSIPFWNRRDEIQSLMSHVSAVRGALKHYQDDKDEMLSDLHNALSQQLATVYLSLADRKPYAVCPYCDGAFEYRDEYGHHDCKACHNTGLMAKALYDKVPPQFRARREKALK
jgi:hypothetical protein